MFLQTSQPNILRKLINTCWYRNVLSFRRLQKVQIVFKADSPPLFFFPEFQISADTLRQKGKFLSVKKSVLLSLKQKTPPPSSKVTQEGEFPQFSQSNQLQKSPKPVISCAQGCG